MMPWLGKGDLCVLLCTNVLFTKCGKVRFVLSYEVGVALMDIRQYVCILIMLGDQYTCILI
jgi:hypothetical protein